MDDRAEAGGHSASSERIPWQCVMRWAMRLVKLSGVEDAGEGVVAGAGMEDKQVVPPLTLFFAHN